MYIYHIFTIDLIVCWQSLMVHDMEAVYPLQMFQDTRTNVLDLIISPSQRGIHINRWGHIISIHAIHTSIWRYIPVFILFVVSLLHLKRPRVSSLKRWMTDPNSPPVLRVGRVQDTVHYSPFAGKRIVQWLVKYI